MLLHTNPDQWLLLATGALLLLFANWRRTRGEARGRNATDANATGP